MIQNYVADVVTVRTVFVWLKVTFSNSFKTPVSSLFRYIQLYLLYVACVKYKQYLLHIRPHSFAR